MVLKDLTRGRERGSVCIGFERIWNLPVQNTYQHSSKTPISRVTVIYGWDRNK